MELNNLPEAPETGTAGTRKEYRSYAKINLSLEIIRRRPDGFHELASIMQTIGLYDVIIVNPAQDLQFDSNIPELVDENNLVWQAALRLHELAPENDQRGADIFLYKQIPVAAGMGGGSSNAATTLLALNTLWELNLSLDQLAEVAAGLGSDVPFFLSGGTALVEGRGEKVTPLPLMAETWLVLLFPPVEMPPGKTRELYKMLSTSSYTSGGITRNLARTIERGERPPYSLFYNGFEQVVYERFPSIDNYRQAMVEAGAAHVWVSGSGPTLFTIGQFQDEAKEIYQNLIQGGYAAFLVPTVKPEPF